MSYFDRTWGKSATRLFKIGFATLAAAGTAIALTVAGCGGSSGGGSSTSSGVAIWTTNQAVTPGSPDPAGVIEFTQNQLRHLAVANVPPKKQNLSGSFVSPQDDFFDFFNDLFVIDGGNGAGTGSAVYAFTPKQLSKLKSNDAPKPAFSITDLGGDFPFQFPQFGALDASGNLWVSDSTEGVVFMFSAAQVNAGGGSGITPAGVLECEDFDGPLGLAFDGAGGLWVANNGDASLVHFSSTQLATVSGPTFLIEDVELTSNEATVPSLSNPWGLAFDGFGDLWVTNETPVQTGGQGSFVEFTPNQLTSSGSPDPNVVITSTTVDDQPSIDDPNGDAIDIKDDFLFIANAGGNSISAYNLDGIASGTPTPNVFVFGSDTTLNAPAGLTIGKAF